MKKYFKLSLIVCLFSFSYLHAQTNFTVTVNGIKENDSVRIIVQKSSEILLKKWVKYDASGTATANFNLDNGKWALKIDATGYTYPSNTVFSIPEDASATITLTPLLNTDYTYTWQDDDSAAGHATERYVNEPAKIVVLNDSVKVPSDFSAIKLRTEYGVVLSDDIEPWSSEDSYRLYKMFAALPYLPFGEGAKVDFETGENVRGVFRLTNDEQDDDLKIEIIDGIKYATVSQSAFTYATPQIVTIDGIKGKFYSKRLYHVIVKFITDFAKDDAMLAWIAREKFGVEFLSSDQRTEDLMNEDASNFQAFFNTEKLEILSMFEELPEGFQKQNGLKYLVRRINGQDHPIYPTAAAIAWAGSNTIEFMSKAFSNGDISDSRRLILHEKAHFLWAYTFDEKLKSDWAELGGWFLDPTGASGWSTYNTTESVSAYAHLKNPNEDMAESIAFYLTNPDALLSVSVRKYEFIRDHVMHGTRYIAQIRQDLTFTVYNLFPDYTYPGKVTKIEINVKGTSEEDKEVTIRATLNSVNPEKDGAAQAYLRFASSIGTIHDIRLNPENGQAQDSILVGKTTFNKLEKSGYWGLAYFNLSDLVGNVRYENTSTLGMKLYIENPLEDIMAPQFNHDYKLEVVTGNFSDGDWMVQPDSSGVEMKALKISFSHYDKSPTSRGYARLNVPNSTMSEVYNRDIQGPAITDSIRGFDNGFNSNKYFEMYLAIQDYYQSGWYSTTYSFVQDIAGNIGYVYHVKDTTDFHIALKDKFKIFKTVRDSIYIETPYPDYKKPEIDVNNITIIAEPTNPQAPDGETSVKVAILARDLSDYEGHESGVNSVSFTFRDPLGGIHGYQTGNGTMVHPDLANGVGSPKPQGDSEWRIYNFIIQLPKGSPPGQWGMASAEVKDRAGNREQYSFVEYVRFDIIESDVELEEALVATITDKVVNLANADAITANISCKPCKDKNYVYTIYSLMGGNVVRGTGVFSADTITLTNINTTGVVDGVIKLTVQVTDDQDRLIATTTTDYTKDTVLPKAYYTRSNLENQGTSNLDEFVVSVTVEPADLNGKYNLDFSEYSSTPSGKYNSSFKDSSILNSIALEGVISQTDLSLSNVDLSSLVDGIITSSLIVTDPNGNVGEPQIIYYKKENGKISLIGSSLNPLSLNSFQKQFNYEIYPNPTNDFVTIKIPKSSELEKIELYSLLGEFIDEYTKNTISLQSLPSGCYLLKIHATGGITTKKVVKK